MQIGSRLNGNANRMSNLPRNLRKAHAITDRGNHSLAETQNIKVEPASAD